MINKLVILNVIALSLFLLSCDGGPRGSGTKAVTKVNHLLTEFESGQIYYETNCASCHSAGSVDTTSAFGATDLTQNDKKLKIVNNMTKFKNVESKSEIYGGKYNLMERFNNVPTDRVHQLKTYLNNIK